MALLLVELLRAQRQPGGLGARSASQARTGEWRRALNQGRLGCADLVGRLERVRRTTGVP